MASRELDDLIAMFLDKLDDNERQRVIDKLEREEPEVAKILKRVWDMERRNKEMKKTADELIDIFKNL